MHDPRAVAAIVGALRQVHGDDTARLMPQDGMTLQALIDALLRAPLSDRDLALKSGEAKLLHRIVVKFSRNVAGRTPVGHDQQIASILFGLKQRQASRWKTRQIHPPGWKTRQIRSPSLA
jgi:hypothetical protein